MIEWTGVRPDCDGTSFDFNGLICECPSDIRSVHGSRVGIVHKRHTPDRDIIRTDVIPLFSRHDVPVRLITVDLTVDVLHRRGGPAMTIFDPVA
jgi:hypothetical protein